MHNDEDCEKELSRHDISLNELRAIQLVREQLEFRTPSLPASGS